MGSPRKVLVYLSLGLVTAGVEFVVFVLLEGVVNIYVASTVSFLVGLVVSFLFNKFLVFRNDKQIKLRESVQFLVLGLVNSQASSIITLALSLVVPGYVAKVTSMFFIAMWNYLVMNKIIFKIVSR